MLNLSSQVKNIARMALGLTLGLSLFVAGTASATRCDSFEQVHAETAFNRHAHKHLDVACKKDWYPISCEPMIGGEDDIYNYDDNRYNQEYVAINEAHPIKFSDRHGYEHRNYRNHYGCHFRANNFLSIFGHAGSGDDHYRDDHREDDRRGDFYWKWKLKGFVTCVPKKCVEKDHHRDWDAWDSREVPPVDVY